jgi:hypothetical protein
VGFVTQGVALGCYVSALQAERIKALRSAAGEENGTVFTDKQTSVGISPPINYPFSPSSLKHPHLVRFEPADLNGDGAREHERPGAISDRQRYPRLGIASIDESLSAQGGRGVNKQHVRFSQYYMIWVEFASSQTDFEAIESSFPNLTFAVKSYRTEVSRQCKDAFILGGEVEFSPKLDAPIRKVP